MGKTNKQTELKIGLIADDIFVSKYHFQLVENAKKIDSVAITHLITQKTNRVEKSILSRAFKLLFKFKISILLQRTLFLLIRIVENFLLRRGQYFDHFRKISLEELVPNIVSVEPLISKSGLVYRYSVENIDKIKSLNLDVLIMFGSGILKGDLLSSSKYGVISFHHGDSRFNRGSPAGFWEVYSKKPTTGFVIQRLTEELDGGDVLFRGHFLTQYYYYLNQAVLYHRSNHYMLKLLSDLAMTRTLPPIMDPEIYFNQLFRLPTPFQLFKYAANFVYRFTAKQISRKIFKFDNRWELAFSRVDWQDLVMWRSTRIKNPRNHFLADPFLINENGEDFCFVEDFDYTKNKGCIAVYQLEEQSTRRLGEAIVEPFHLSFPYLFRYNGKLFMCPETYKNNDIRVYECVDFPLKWKLSNVLMRDIAAADTMIFEKDEKWWMFTNIDPTESGDLCYELDIFYSDNPLSTNWTPHPKNPIYCDASMARNGGLLYKNNSIYRVSQQHGFDQYGTGFTINKICILNTKDYSEEKITAIEPNFFKHIQGCHHIDSKNNLTVFDYVKFSKITR